MKICENGTIRELTPEEKSEALIESAKFETLEKQRPLSEAEVMRMLITTQVNSVDVDDGTALRMRTYYPQWAAGKDYPAGFRVQYADRLFKVIQGHTAQTGWEPDKAASLWTEICESHSGTLDDAIPYNGNMALEEGKYYVQDDLFYLCVRNTENPVYHALRDLVGLYVEEV